MPRVLAAGTVDECLAILRDGSRPPRLVAGGTDLGVESNLRGTTMAASRQPRSDRGAAGVFQRRPSASRIGAALPLNDIGARWTRRARGRSRVADTVRVAADSQSRDARRQSCDGVADRRRRAAASRARCRRSTSPGRRDAGRCRSSSFFTGYRKTALRPARSSRPSRFRSRCPQSLRFYKVAKRRLDDISTVAAAMALDCRRRTACRRARFAFGGVAATPMRVASRPKRAVDRTAVERWRRSSACSACSNATLTADVSDHRGSEEYRLEVSKSPRREVLMGAVALHDDRRHAASARERPRARDRRGALRRRSAAAGFRTFFMRGRSVRRTRTRG